MAATSDRVYEVLKQRVIAGGYAPGEQLKEERLARELETSRTPVRAALTRLVEDGLATAEVGRGVHVSEWTEFDIQETFDLRSLLEGHAAGLASRRGGARAAAKLDALNEEMERVIAEGGEALPHRLQQINSQFHRSVLEASGSPRLRSTLGALIDMPMVIGSHFVSSPLDRLQSLRHHRELAMAIRSGDGELARQVMQLHLRIAAHRLKAQRTGFAGTSDGGAVACAPATDRGEET